MSSSLRFQQVPKGEKVNVSKQELELGVGLIDKLTSEEFNPENYKDEYRTPLLLRQPRRASGSLFDYLR
jgi:non-homologous end joining protein Ku